MHMAAFAARNPLFILVDAERDNVRSFVTIWHELPLVILVAPSVRQTFVVPVVVLHITVEH